jgi:hypothetical protein
VVVVEIIGQAQKRPNGSERDMVGQKYPATPDELTGCEMTRPWRLSISPTPVMLIGGGAIKLSVVCMYFVFSRGL